MQGPETRPSLLVRLRDASQSEVWQEFQEETWRAFWMTGVEGESINDVARILGKTPGAIRIARCRVLARLKEEVTRFEESNVE